MASFLRVAPGTGIRFGIYTGSLKEKNADATGARLPEGSSAEDKGKNLVQTR